MSKLKNLITWTLVWSATGLLQVATQRGGMDPTSDFSFAMAYQRASGAYTLMPESQVARILATRMELLPKSQSRALARHLLTLCERYRFDPAFVLSLIQVESSFKVKATSSVGALGLMQLMPKTAELVALRHGIKYTGARSLTDPFTNISIGLAYLYTLRERYRDQSPYFHVAAYNIGPNKLDELRSRPQFQPVSTKQYFDKIRRGVPTFRASQRDA